MLRFCVFLVVVLLVFYTAHTVGKRRGRGAGNVVSWTPTVRMGQTPVVKKKGAVGGERQPVIAYYDDSVGNWQIVFTGTYWPGDVPLVMDCNQGGELFFFEKLKLKKVNVTTGSINLLYGPVHARAIAVSQKRIPTPLVFYVAYVESPQNVIMAVDTEAVKSRIFFNAGVHIGVSAISALRYNDQLDMLFFAGTSELTNNACIYSVMGFQEPITEFQVWACHASIADVRDLEPEWWFHTRQILYTSNVPGLEGLWATTANAAGGMNSTRLEKDTSVWGLNTVPFPIARITYFSHKGGVSKSSESGGRGWGLPKIQHSLVGQEKQMLALGALRRPTSTHEMYIFGSRIVNKKRRRHH